MRIEVQVKTRSKKEIVEKKTDISFVVRVNTPPIDGKANKRVVELLASYLGVPKSSIELVRGHKSKLKVFEVIS